MYHGPLRLQFGDRFAAGRGVPTAANVPPDREGGRSERKGKIWRVGKRWGGRRIGGGVGDL